MKCGIGFKSTQPSRNPSYVIIINGHIDLAGMFGKSVPVKQGLDQVIPQKSSPTGNQNLFACQASEFLG
jgi:hypothetical protein